MITEDRLKEIETEGRAAILFKAELQELVDVYRAKTKGVPVFKDNEGLWLHFKSPDKVEALISLDSIAEGRGPIVTKAIKGWADSL